MRFEVVIRTRGMERVVATTRRENGAISERDIAVESAYRNAIKHTEGDPFAHAVQGAVADDPNAVAVVYFDDIATIIEVITYRRVPALEAPDTLEDDLLASLYAIGAPASL